MKRFLVPALIIATLPLSSTFGQYNTRRGSVLGGLAGAAAGVAIGEHNDEPLAGALIGGALGMVSGATLGNARDRQIADYRAYQYQQQQQYAQQVAKTVTSQDVISMTRSGLSEPVIINHIQANGVRQELKVADVIFLHENGVSQQVISAMQRANVGAAAVTTAPAPVYHSAPPVVIERYVSPRYHYAPPVHHHGPRYRPRPGFQIHFSHRH